MIFRVIVNTKRLNGKKDFRRIGMRFTDEPTYLKSEDLSQDQIDKLKNETALIVIEKDTMDSFKDISEVDAQIKEKSKSSNFKKNVQSLIKKRKTTVGESKK